MKTPWIKNLCQFHVGVLFCLVSSAPTVAQIKPDTTLPQNSQVTQLGNVRFIQGGTTAGNNLFHSFSEFSVPTGSAALFNNASTIQNIFTRVTGSSISNIDGLLKANGTANLFLLNPNGIIFGKNAQLNIGGSFVGTTANAMQFGSQGIFSASLPNSPALLTVEPSAFLFNQIANQPITINSQGSKNVGLAVPNGQSLLILGGNITLDGGRCHCSGGSS